jgi:hypothetical protein
MKKCFVFFEMRTESLNIISRASASNFNLPLPEGRAGTAWEPS